MLLFYQLIQTGASKSDNTLSETPENKQTDLHVRVRLNTKLNALFFQNLFKQVKAC